MHLFEALDGNRMACPPVIGITASPKVDEESVARRPLGYFARVDLDYIEGVTDAGGIPIVLPPAIGPQAAETLLDRVDGLLLSGGTDLDPGYYGERPVRELGPTIPERDAWEMTLLWLAIRRKMPIFGICRGMQILNVALGGALYQDLPSQHGADVPEHCREAPKCQPVHEAEVLRGSWLGGLTCGRSLGVNSYHHQGIKILGKGLRASAVSPDRVVEGIEWHDMSERWLLGVQWHPEGMRHTSSMHQNLFEAHVRAAERHAALRAAA
ncbi:MAG TPA: gamma-glutamyl-gamma-aminobutyrate hydrolase family protein [Rubrobacter sp.]|nr:gamma-glutamyl-gamma-aminobutyrate hydrolase family protein [Rubrobacter sp.]